MNYNNLIDILDARVSENPEKTAFFFIKEQNKVSYQELYDAASHVASNLQSLCKLGDRVLLLYPPGVEYITVFFGCIMAGVLPVPAYPPRDNHHASRIKTIISDAKADFALTTDGTKTKIQALLDAGPIISHVTLYSFDEINKLGSNHWERPCINENSPAFLQYTSGSTSAPKGVVVSHKNLLTNLESIKEASNITQDSRVCSWLPPYHDMGLIGGILSPVYSNMPSYILSPIHFIQKPFRWLQAISKYKITISGGPNFGFEYCLQKATAQNLVDIDLSSWTVAFNGAEPIRHSTLQEFAKVFSSSGFNYSAFRASYGLAESTLLVGTSTPVVNSFKSRALEKSKGVYADSENDESRVLIGIDKFPKGQELLIVGPESKKLCEEGDIGEVWLKSASVADGYWNNETVTKQVFRATIKGKPSEHYLRTGDLGFIREGTVYITGRLKELIIIRGVNYYPHDIENEVSKDHEAINAESVMAFSTTIDETEQLIVLVEISREFIGQEKSIVSHIYRSVLDRFGLKPHAIIPVKRGALPKTSSGKKERRTASKKYLNDEFISIVPTSTNDSASDLLPADADSVQDVAAGNTAFDQFSLEHWLLGRIAEISGSDIDAISPLSAFTNSGLDSVRLVQLAGELEDKLGREVSPTLVYEYPNVRRLTEHLCGKQVETSHSGTPKLSPIEPIAIVGMGCRFPSANGIEEFWRLLCDGTDAIAEAPTARFDLDSEPGEGSNVDWGGFIEDIDLFDYDFFGISRREAEQMDPQQRLLMQTVWESLENAGIAPSQMQHSKTGVFMGVSSNDYGLLQASSINVESPYAILGNASSIIANRISYYFNFVGPSLSIDTACSSSLVAVQLACQSLRSGESSVAIAGGSNMILSKDITASFAKGGFMAADGRCKSFGDAADGYVRGEGVGVVVLKPLSHAVKDGDNIYAVINGGAVNQDGRSNGITAPNPKAQIAVLEAAYRASDIDVSDVSYIEAHGTGTPLGDPIECSALGRVLNQQREQACRLGSVKSNIGHLEAAAGIAGVIKTALALKNRKIPASLHNTVPNKYIKFSELGLELQKEMTAWPKRDKPLVAGVSSFGFGGTNAHIVMSGAPTLKIDTESQTNTKAVTSFANGKVLLLSAASPDALRTLSRAYLDYLMEHPCCNLQDLCFTASCGRSHHEYRSAIEFDTREQLELSLRELNSGSSSELIARPPLLTQGPHKIVFVFSGHGCQWQGMGLEMMEVVPGFREALEDCSVYIEQYAGWSLIEKLEQQGSDSSQDIERDTEILQPAIIAIQIALANTWRSWGIEPIAVVGHSMGEVAAAHFCGAISLRDAIRIACERSRLAVLTKGNGGMLYLELSESDSARLIEPYGDLISIASLNAPTATLVSGDLKTLEELSIELEERGDFYWSIDVEYASHSAQMDTVKRDLESYLAELKTNTASIPFYSTVLGGKTSGKQLNANYWGRNIREPVKLFPVISELLEEGCDLFMEISPNPVLTSFLNLTLVHHDKTESALVLSSSRRDQEVSELSKSLVSLYELGVELSYDKIFTAGNRLTNLPRYPWQAERCWIAAPSETSQLTPFTHSASHPLLGREKVLAALQDTQVWQNELDINTLEYLYDHAIEGTPLMPAVAYLEMALAACRSFSQSKAIKLQNIELIRPIVFSSKKSIQSTLQKDNFSVHSLVSEGSWDKHVLMKLSDDITRPVSGNTLSELKYICSVEIDCENFYRELAKSGLEYGANFRRIRKLWRGEQKSLGLIDCNYDETLSKYTLHPGILDSAFQVIGGAVSNDKMKQGAFMPVSIEEFHCLTEFDTHTQIYCFASLNDSDDENEVSGNLQLYLADGSLFASINKLVLRRVTASQIKNNWLQKVQWWPRKEASSLDSTCHSGETAYLFLCRKNSEISRRLAARLEGMNGICEIIECHDFSDLWPQIEMLTFRPTHVIDCRAAHHSLTPEPMPNLVARDLDGAISLLNKTSTFWPEGGVEIVFVTQNAQAVKNSEEAYMLCSSPIWGLIRSASREFEFGNLRLVDIGQTNFDSNIAALVDDINGFAREKQLAYRDGQCYVARLVEAEKIRSSKLSFNVNGSYVITGGLGDLGLETAYWMVQNGAKHIALLGRSHPSEKALAVITKMQKLGANVRTFEVDVSSLEALSSVFQAIRQAMPEIKGVFHAAGILDDGMLSQLTQDRLNRVLSPKVSGSWNLHLVTELDELDYFVMFSSASSVLGSPGQASYGAANAFMDMLSHERVSKGLAGASINWSFWASIGLAATDERGGRLGRLGYEGIPTDRGLELLGDIISSQTTQVAVLPINAQLWSKNSADIAQDPFYEPLVRSLSVDFSKDVQTVLKEFLAEAPENRLQLLQSYVQAVVARSLKSDPQKINVDSLLVSLGMDSIMALELKNQIEFDTGIALPILKLLEGASVNVVANEINAMLLLDNSSTSIEDNEGITQSEGELEVFDI